MTSGAHTPIVKVILFNLYRLWQSILQWNAKYNPLINERKGLTSAIHNATDAKDPNSTVEDTISTVKDPNSTVEGSIPESDSVSWWRALWKRTRTEAVIPEVLNITEVPDSVVDYKDTARWNAQWMIFVIGGVLMFAVVFACALRWWRKSSQKSRRQVSVSTEETPTRSPRKLPKAKKSLLAKLKNSIFSCSNNSLSASTDLISVKLHLLQTPPSEAIHQIQPEPGDAPVQTQTDAACQTSMDPLPLLGQLKTSLLFMRDSMTTQTSMPERAMETARSTLATLKQKLESSAKVLLPKSTENSLPDGEVGDCPASALLLLKQLETVDRRLEECADLLRDGEGLSRRGVVEVCDKATQVTWEDLEEKKHPLMRLQRSPNDSPTTERCKVYLTQSPRSSRNQPGSGTAVNVEIMFSDDVKLKKTL